MLGWQPSSVVPGLYPQADVGVNLDAFHYETQLGTRTRLVEMMHYGLPVITTLGCELSHIVEDQGLGLNFPDRGCGTFSNHILAMAGDKSLQKNMRDRRRNIRTDNFPSRRQPGHFWIGQKSQNLRPTGPGKNPNLIFTRWKIFCGRELEVCFGGFGG
jgi:glycosyltransferase involved in cell wall biosynthesis